MTRDEPPTRSEVVKVLGRLLREAQEEMGESMPQLSDNTTPIGDLPNFDSLSAASVTTAIAAELLVPIDSWLFWSKQTRKPLEFGEIVDRVLSLADAAEEG